MTKVALSLASLSHPNAKYHPRRSPRERKGRAWAREHAYAYDQTATVDISGFSGDGSSRDTAATAHGRAN